MFGLNFLSPMWALMGLIAVPVVLLYLLRQKRPDLPVSSTILWARTLADMRASTPFQRLRRNLLLLLQLLILAALVFTLMRPVVQATASRSEAGVIVIDATASMQTHDGGSEESRLDRAKIEAKALVDRMRPGDRYMLIADGGGMDQVRSGFSTSKSELKGLIDSVRPSDTGSDLSESLLLAATSLRAIGAEHGKEGGVAAGQVWLFSDGAGVRVPDLSGGSQEAMRPDLLNFVRIGNSDHSVGVTRLSITPVPRKEKTYQVFVGLKNAWSLEKKIGVTLAWGTRDNFLPDQARFATLPADGTGGVVFENVTVDPGKLFIRVDDTDDDFPLDNTAYGIIAPSQKVKVLLVTKGNEWLERMLKAAVDVGIAQGQVIAPEFYNPALSDDLYILDGLLPPADKLPHGDAIFVRPRVTGTGNGPVDVAGFPVSNEIHNPVILRWRREDPVMQYLNLGDLHVSRALLMDRDPAAVELVSTVEGPLIAYKDFGSVRRYLISFDLFQESDWYASPSLIMFMKNIIEQTRERHFIGMPQMITSGNPARLWSPNRSGDSKPERAHVLMPDGSEADVGVKEGTAEFGNTDHLGFYEVTWPDSRNDTGEKQTLFAANLLNEGESDIRPRTLQTAEGGRAAGNVQEMTSVAKQNQEIWRWLAAAALGVLLLEWWAYHRRVG